MQYSNREKCPGSFEQMIWSEERHDWVCAVCKTHYSRNNTKRLGCPHEHYVPEPRLAAAPPAQYAEAPAVEQAPVHQPPIAALIGANWVMVDRTRLDQAAKELAELMLEEVHKLLDQAS